MRPGLPDRFCQGDLLPLLLDASDRDTSSSQSLLFEIEVFTMQ